MTLFHSVRIALCCAAIASLVSIVLSPADGQDLTNIDPTSLQSATAPVAWAVWLDSLDLTKVTFRRFGPHAGKSITGNPITLSGSVYQHGIGAGPFGGIGVALNGNASRFVSMVGVDDDTNKAGAVSFRVWVDHKKTFDSGVVHGGDRAKYVSLDLNGASEMDLQVVDSGGGFRSDHADWAGALLVMTSATAAAPTIVAPTGIDTPVDQSPIPIFSYAAPDPQTQIHGPLITGASPGRPFEYLVPATGTAPLIYSASGLPPGLTIDHSTGIITGISRSPGVWNAKLRVSGPGGRAQRNLTFVLGDHKLTLTPPMGWNSWNIFHGDVDQAKVTTAADWMVRTGLAAHGYQYINIDDTWEGPRDAAGNIATNSKFPDMLGLANHIHSLGLKFGIYSSPGPTTCAGYPATYQHELQDIQSYCNWGVDYLKYDWCSYGGVSGGNDVPHLVAPYALMRKQLDMAPRDIVFSLCQYGMGDVWNWGGISPVNGNLWRTTGDIGPSYRSMIGNGFSEVHPGQAQAAGPSHWNDPDMLFLHALKPNEQVTHMSLWALLAAPLIIGSDLSNLTPYTRDVLENDEVIAIDQDPLGKEATPVEQKDEYQIWSRPLADGTVAVGLFNTGVDTSVLTVNFAQIGLKGAQPVRDVWTHKDLGRVDGAFAVSVPGHGAALVKIGKPGRIAIPT